MVGCDAARVYEKPTREFVDFANGCAFAGDLREFFCKCLQHGRRVSVAGRCVMRMSRVFASALQAQALSAACRWQLIRWSLTMPEACMKA